MEKDVIARLPAEWQTFFKYLEKDLNKAEIIYNDMMFSQYGSQPEWTGLLKSLLKEDPYIVEKHLRFKPRLILLPEKVQDHFFTFLLSHCRISKANMSLLINGLSNHCKQELQSYESFKKLTQSTNMVVLNSEELGRMDQNEQKRIQNDTALNANSDTETEIIEKERVTMEDVTGDVIIIEDNSDEEWELPAKRQKLDKDNVPQNVIESLENKATELNTLCERSNSHNKTLESESSGINESYITDEGGSKAEEVVSYAEETEVPQEILNLAQRLKDIWVNNGTDIPESDMEELAKLSVTDIELVGQYVEFSSMSDDSVLTVCSHLVTCWENFSYTAVVCFLKNILCNKVDKLTQNASRQLVHAITLTAGTFPKQFIDVVMILGAKNGENLTSYKSDIYMTVIKDSLNSGTRIYFLQQLVSSSVTLSDHSITVLQCVIDSGCDYDGNVFQKLLEVLHNFGLDFAKNLKFGKLLLSLINKHGKDLGNIDILEKVINSHNTFLKKTILSSWKKLKS